MENPIDRFIGIKITHVAAIPGTQKIYMAWDSGESAVLEISEWIETDRHFRCLADEKAFQSVKVGPFQSAAIWLDRLDVGADTFRLLAQEQGTVIHEQRKVG